MKGFVTVLIAVLSMVVLAGSAVAGSTEAKATGSEYGPKTKTPVKTMRFTGDVVSVNQEARTLTVKSIAGSKAREKTFTADAKATAALADLKAGDRVRVSYVRNGAQMTAESIVKSGQHAARK